MGKQVNPAKVAFGVTCLGAAASSNADMMLVGLDDVRGPESRFFRINATTGDFEWLGNAMDGVDLEALAQMDISGIVGGHTPVNMGEFSPVQIGSIPERFGSTSLELQVGRRSNEVTSIAYSPASDTLFGFIKGVGLVEFDQDRLGEYSTLVPTNANVQGLAASLDGSTLYAVRGMDLMVYDTAAMERTNIIDLGEFTDARRIENLATYRDGRLGFIGHLRGGDIELVLYDTASGEAETNRFDGLPLRRVESVAFAQPVPPPASVMLLLAGAISSSGRPRRTDVPLDESTGATTL